MKEIEIAKKTIIEEVERFGLTVLKILLFGSRVRGDFEKDSDWDLFVIINKQIDFPLKRKITSAIRRRLADADIPNDIIIQAESIVNERKNNVGYLTYYAVKEGMEV